jgi:nucleobase:cation symporter-1, NCS1 family
VIALPGMDKSLLVLQLGEWMGITLGQLLCVLIFTVLNVIIIYFGIESVKWLQLVAAPILLCGGIALFSWACYEVGLVNMLAATESTGAPNDNTTVKFFIGVTSVVGIWSTMALNMLDFTRFGKSHMSPIIGQLIGFPVTMTAVAFVGIAVTGATIVMFGYPIWNLPDLFSHWPLGVLVLANFLVLLSTLATNFTANVVSPANDFSNLWPEKFSYRGAGYFTCVLGLLLFPWKLYTATNFITIWLLGYSPIMAAMGGVMLADFYIIQKTILDLPALYDNQDGRYWYIKGFNWRGFLATALGYAPCFPGFLFTIGVINDLPIWVRSFYDYSWFVAFFVGGSLYIILMFRYISTNKS